MFTEVAPQIYTVDHAVAEGKNAVLLGRRAALAIDTGTYVEEGQALVDFIRGQGYRPNRLLYTHGHGDHILGSEAFRLAHDVGASQMTAATEIDLEVMAHAKTPVEMRRLLPALAHRGGTTPDDLAGRILWPTLTFRDELFLDLGDLHLHVFPTSGHSQDGVSVYVEEHKLLIAGDAVVTGIVPAIGDGDSRTLEATLHRLQARRIEILVPGHGPVIHGKAAVLDWLTWLQDYLAHVRRLVQDALGDGVEPEHIVEMAGYAQFVGDRLPRDRHSMPRRHAATVSKIVQEEKQASG